MVKKSVKGFSKLFSLFMLFMMLFVIVSQPAASLLISEVIVDPSSESATVSWKTDVAANSTVLYGQDLLDEKKTSQDMVTEHSLTLDGLSPSTQYVYKVLSYDGISNAESQVVQFITNATVAGNETIFMDVKVDGNPVPAYYNKRIDFEIDSVPGAEIMLRKDGQLKRHAVIGSTGKIYFRDFDLSPDVPNNIEIESSLGSQVLKNSYSIILDNDPPVIETTGLPNVILSQKFTLNGTVNEPVTLQITSGLSNSQLANIDTKSLPAGNFSEIVSFQNGDGNYDVVLVFTDQAGNSVTQSYPVIMDTSDPTITLNPGIAQLSPSYVNKVRIKGVTEPGATVVVFVNNRTNAAGTFSTNVIDMLKTFGTLVSGQGDYSTTADASGNFAIDIVLSQEIEVEEYLGQRHTAPTTGGTGTVVERTFTTVPAWKNHIKVVAIDRVGRSSAPQEGDIIFTTCDYGGDWEVTIEQITPTMLQQQHLIEGIGSFGFNYRMKWVGPGNEANAKIADIKITSSTKDVFNQKSEPDKGYELGKILVGEGSSNIYENFNENVMIGTVKVDFRRYGGSMSDLSQYDDLKVMLTMDIDYSYTNLGNTNIVGRQMRCIPLSIAIDKKVDMSRPTGLLKTSVNFLNKTIEALDSTTKIVSKIQNYVFYASIATHLVYYGSAISQRTQCFKYQNGIPSDGDKILEPGTTACQDDEKCEPCWEAIKSKEKKARLNHWVSDRIFCPSIPSAQEYAKKTGAVRKYFFDGENIYTENKCRISTSLEPAADGNTGQNIVTTENTVTADNDECKAQYEYEWRPACLGVSNLYKYSFPDEEVKMNAIERLADTASNICKATKVENDVIYISDKKCCSYHTIASEKKSTDFCFYIKDPTVDGEQFTGIYEADYEENMICVRDPKDPDKCFQENGKIRLDPNKVDSVFLPQGKEPVRIDDIKDPELYNNDEDKFNTAMKNRCLTYKVEGPRGKYVIEPTNGLIRSFQCACIPAFNNYVKMYKNMAEMTRNCFNELLISGDTSAGFCKAVLTMYICDLVYDAIKCGGKYFSRQSTIKMNGRSDGSDEGNQNEFQGITSFFGAMNDAGQDVSKNVQNRYGNSATFKALFTERTLVHTVCIGAFTGDWNLDLEGLFSSASEKMVVESVAEVYPTTRQFQSSSPFTGRVDYIYHMGIWIIAGADLTFSAKLICSNDNSCDYGDGTCDCMHLGYEKIHNIGEISGSLRNGGTYSKDAYVVVEGQDVRYDTVLLEYKYIDNDGKERLVQIKKKIKETGYMPATCKFDISLKQFLCAFDVGNRGFLSFGSIIPRIKDGRSTFNVGDQINLDGTVVKKSADEEQPKKGFLYYEVLDSADVKQASSGKDSIPITNDGTHDLSVIFGSANLRVLDDWFEGTGSDCYVNQPNSAINVICGGPLRFKTRVTFSLPPPEKKSSCDMMMSFSTGEGQKITYSDGGTSHEYANGEQVCFGGEGRDLQIDGVPVTISWNIKPENPNTIPSPFDLKASATGPSDFTLIVSLHYGEQNNPDQIDLSKPVTNGIVEERYRIKFTALPTSVKQKCPQTPTKATVVSNEDYSCACGTVTCFSQWAGVTKYCYFGECVDYPACINLASIRQLGVGDDITEEFKIASPTGFCACEPNAGKVTVGTGAGQVRYCCLTQASPTKLTLQSDVKNCLTEKSKYTALIT